MITVADILDMSERVDLKLTILHKRAKWARDGYVVHDDVADGFVSDATWREAFRYEPYWAELVYRVMFSGYMTWPDEAAEAVASKINIFGWQTFVKWAEGYLPTARYGSVYPARLTDDGDIVRDVNLMAVAR